MAKTTKQTGCPDVKRIGKVLEIPNGDRYRVLNGKLECKSRWASHWYARFGYRTTGERGILWPDCPRKITLQYFKWLGECLEYEIED